MTTVLSVAYPFAPVGPHAVGGAEVILSALDAAMVQRGVGSLVVACEESQAAGGLFSFRQPSSETLSQEDRVWMRGQVQRAIDAALTSQRVDLVHMHGLDCFDYRIPRHIPVLVTLHLPVAWYPPETWSRLSSNVTLCFVSETQRASAPHGIRHFPVVRNGVPILPLSSAVLAQPFALAVGRICPEKNVHHALEAGTLANIPVLIAGKVFPYEEHLRYFEQRVKPLLEAPSMHRMLGAVDRAAMYSLLQQATCLLHPTIAPETSSLVAMEALAAGTPVIAYPSGALPEIVEQGRTGFLVNTADEMAKAMQRLPKIRRADCRRAAEASFSEEQMVADYLALYERLIESHGMQESRRYA